jgi:hypothetical protein
MARNVNNIFLFFTSFLLMTLWVRLGSETGWAATMGVSGVSSLVAILLPVRRYRIRR